jgi:dihydroneopterin aldolase
MAAMNDRIHLIDAPLACHIGVSGEERSKEQELRADLWVETDIRRAAEADNVNATIDYSRLLDAMVEAAAEHEYRLLETLAETIAARILSSFPVQRVHLLLKKPAALRRRGVGAPAIEIERER